MEDGFGLNRWPDGSWYEGEYKQGQQHGTGKMVVKAGSVKLFEYTGEWRYGK